MQLTHHFELPPPVPVRRPLLKAKILLAMKLTAILILSACLQISAKGISQKITLYEENAPLEKVLKAIQKQSDFAFLYNHKILAQAMPVTVSLKEVSLEEALKACFKGQPFSYSIVDNTIVIKKEAATAIINPLVAEVLVPPVIIRGKIVQDNSGEPVVGASIVIKGSKKGTTSGKEGDFSISSERGNTLVISYIGFEPYEYSVKEATTVTIRLKTTSTSMNNMVITGVYARPRENFTGAASSFTQEDLRKISNNNLMAALAVLDPTVQLRENINLGSNPNVLPDIVLRGGNTLVDPTATNSNPFNYANNPNAPLFILDGFEVPLQRINDLDMNRIARVDVLKDAAATSIYGSRAANGVIIIETIRPQEGRLRVSYTGNFNLETPDLTGYDLLNAGEKLEIERVTGAYIDGFNERQAQLNVIYNARLAEVKRGVNTDWLAKPLRAGIGSKHNVYVEGGGNAVLYGLNLTYDQNVGVMKGSGRRTTSGNSFLSYRVNNLLFRNDLTVSFNKATNSPYGSFTKFTRLNPYWDPYDSTGALKMVLEDIRDPYTGVRLSNFDAYDNLDGRAAGRAVNPLYNGSLHVVDQATYQNLTNNFFAQWQATPWFKVTARFSYQNQSDESDLFLPAQHTSFLAVPTFEKGTYTKGYGKRTSLEGGLTGDVSKSIGRHLIFATLGANLQQTRFNTESFVVQGFPNPTLDELVLGNRFVPDSKPVGSESTSRLAGYFANVSYAYDNKYLLDVSSRLDGSSQFGTEKRFAPFYSIGAGWNLHKEALFSGIKAINRLKLRYSYGTTGSQSFPSYLGVTTSQYYPSLEYRGVVSTSVLGYGNPFLEWQKTFKHNVGAEITLFRRLDITANYYIETTRGSIISISTPPSTGFNSYNENMGDLLSKGYEIYANYNLMLNPRKRDNWSVFFRAISVKSKIKKISNTIAQLNKVANSTSSSRPLPRYVEGQSNTAIWAVPSLGIDPSSGQEIFRTLDGRITTVYNPLDQMIVGDTRSKLQGTFGTNMEKNGIGVNAAFSFKFGGQAFNQTLVDRVENVTVRLYNVDRRVAEQRWLKPGDKTFFKGLTNAVGEGVTTTMATSRFVQDDDYLSCTSLSVYYRFSDAFNKRIGVSNTRITMFTNDLFTLSSIKRERGLDYPFSHSFSLMLQTTF